MRGILSLIFILLALNSFAQFKTIFPDRTVFFKCKPTGWPGQTTGFGLTGDFIPLKIENTKVKGEDTVYSNYRVFVNYGSVISECDATNKGYSWTGREIIMQKNHREVFINNNGDSIVFHKFAKLNDSWTFFSTNDTHFVATVIKLESENFNISGIPVTDSVMTISLALKLNNDDTSIDHNFNGKEWKISKKYGFVKTYKLLQFPQDTNSMVLAGVDKFNIGVKNLTKREIFDFEVGDEFHIYELNSTDRDRRIIQKVIEKTINTTQGLIIYKISSFNQLQTYNLPTSTDTSWLKVPLLPDFNEINALPIKPFLNYYNYQSIDVTKGLMYKNSVYLNYQSTSGDSCMMVIRYGTSTSYMYYEGLGGPYYINTISGKSFGRSLKYYKKGTKEWGTPYDFALGIYPNKINGIVTLSPNPAADRITISSEGIQNTSYKVFNVEGREVLNGNLIGTEESVDVNSLKAGIYSMMILKEGGVIYTSRFVKN